MPDLYGLDCLSPGCVHRTVTGYRVRKKILRNAICMRCGNGGVLLPPKTDPISNETQADWHVCRRCNSDSWRAGVLIPEEVDRFFRGHQRDSAFAHMNLLGVGHPDVNKIFIVEPGSNETVPPWATYRWMLCTTEALPRTALYFRWRPDKGEMLTPDKIFQCVFRPGDSAAERRNAAEIRFPEEQLKVLFRNSDRGHITSMTALRCQHCGTQLPARALNLAGIRDVEKGE